MADPRLDLLDLADQWVHTSTYEAERDHLAAHPDLLDPAADAAVDEALLPLDDQEAARYRDLRSAAQREGVDAAYRPLLLQVLAHQFVTADPATRRELLTDRRADLLTDQAAATIAALDPARTPGSPPPRPCSTWPGSTPTARSWTPSRTPTASPTCSRPPPPPATPPPSPPPPSAP